MSKIKTSSGLIDEKENIEHENRNRFVGNGLTSKSGQKKVLKISKSRM